MSESFKYEYMSESFQSKLLLSALFATITMAWLCLFVLFTDTDVLYYLPIASLQTAIAPFLGTYILWDGDSIATQIASLLLGLTIEFVIIFPLYCLYESGFSINETFYGLAMAFAFGLVPAIITFLVPSIITPFVYRYVWRYLHR